MKHYRIIKPSLLWHFKYTEALFHLQLEPSNDSFVLGQAKIYIFFQGTKK